MEEQEAEFQVAELPVEIMVNPVRRSPRQHRVVALDIRHLAMEVLAAVAVPEPVVALVAVADTLGAVAGGGITEIHH
jgi:hypothetical protein